MLNQMRMNRAVADAIDAIHTADDPTVAVLALLKEFAQDQMDVPHGASFLLVDQFGTPIEVQTTTRVDHDAWGLNPPEPEPKPKVYTRQPIEVQCNFGSGRYWWKCKLCDPTDRGAISIHTWSRIQTAADSARAHLRRRHGYWR